MSITVLSHAFSEADPAPHRIDRALMVGARPDDDGRALSDNDRLILGVAVSCLQRWGIPTFDYNYRDAEKWHELPSHVRILNMLAIYGGEDFLETQEKARMVVLCNIRRDVEAQDKGRGNAALHRYYNSFGASFASSAHHDDRSRWQNKFDDVKADIVLVHGADSFAPQELNNGKFVQVKTEYASFLIRKSYLEQMEEYLCLHGGPMFDVLTALRKTPDATFYYERMRDRMSVDAAPAARAFA